MVTKITEAGPIFCPHACVCKVSEQNHHTFYLGDTIFACYAWCELNIIMSTSSICSTLLFISLVIFPCTEWLIFFPHHHFVHWKTRCLLCCCNKNVLMLQLNCIWQVQSVAFKAWLTCTSGIHIFFTTWTLWQQNELNPFLWFWKILRKRRRICWLTHSQTCTYLISGCWGRGSGAQGRA